MELKIEKRKKNFLMSPLIVGVRFIVKAIAQYHIIIGVVYGVGAII